MQSESNHDPVRRSYDEVAEEYTARLKDELTYKPLDRGLLGALVEQTEAGSPIADVGCGPGHVAAWVARQGAKAVGIDLSPKMIAVGRRIYPEVEFREGDFLSLPAGDSEFAAVIALYSIIHMEPCELHRAFEEIRRVLRPSGLLLVSFHVGSEVRHLTEWWDHEVNLDFRFFEPEGVIEGLASAGLAVEAQMERMSYPEEVETRRAYLLARRAIP